MVDFLKKFVSNIYIKNITLMLIVAALLIGLTLFSLNRYTRHNETIEVPDLTGLQIQDAASIIKAANLRYEVVDSVFQKGGTPGAILEQIPLSKSQVKDGRTIYLTIQAYSEPLVTIPDLEDASLRQAEALLNTLGIASINIVQVDSDYKDLVLGVEYKGTPLRAGQRIPKGSSITLKVGNGNGSSPISTDSIDNIDTEDSETF